MKSISLRLLTKQDCHGLLQFELTNRSWFEQFIAPRPNSFYSLTGVEHHIDECLHLYQSQQMYPTLMIDREKNILGRANLHKIDQFKGQAEIGYRIAKQAAGRGLTTLAIQQLVEIAFTVLNLKKLDAVVLNNNPASKRVLEKLNFKAVAEMSGQVEIQNKNFNGLKLQLSA